MILLFLLLSKSLISSLKKVTWLENYKVMLKDITLILKFNKDFLNDTYNKIYLNVRFLNYVKMDLTSILDLKRMSKYYIYVYEKRVHIVLASTNEFFLFYDHFFCNVLSNPSQCINSYVDMSILRNSHASLVYGTVYYERLMSINRYGY